MRYLYVDNFRGFTNTFVPIAEVSFLVGENSTGKTSLLNLVRILGSPNFWFGFDFDSEEIKLGHFRDLVSVHASDKGFFRVGFIEELLLGSPGERKPRYNGALLTFAEKSGMPDVTDYSFLSGNYVVSTKLRGNRVRYRTDQLPEGSLNLDALLGEIFPKWCEDHRGDARGMQLLPERKGFGGAPRLIDVLFRVDELLPKDKRTPRGFIPPQFAANLIWLAPIRSKPRRTYDEYKFEFSSEGEHTPYLIKKILSKKSDATKFKAFLERVGKDTGLFDSIAVKRYGRLATSPFELDVILNKSALSVSNVGYGVSQALPVLVEVFARSKGSWFAIQQPEVHLHPRAQAAMGEVVCELAASEQKSFLIETHSDFLIDRFRLSVKLSKKKCNAQILFFDRHEKGNKVHILRIGEDGSLPADQPPGYRKFFVREQLRVLGIDDVHSD